MSVWVCVLAYAGVGYSCVIMCVCVGLNEVTKAARCLTGCKFVCVS